MLSQKTSWQYSNVCFSRQCASLYSDRFNF